MVTEVSMNASINLYENDVASLANHSQSTICLEHIKWCREKASLIDLKNIKDRCLFSATWHYQLKDIIACAYLDSEARNYSIIVIWSLLVPIRPKLLLDCKERISILSFCPIKNYNDVMIGGRLDGKIVIWEVSGHILAENVS